MQNRFPLQVIFALSSLILSKAQDVNGSDHSCLKSSAADDGKTRVTFLREDAAGVRSLYLTLWSEDTRPVACEVNTDPLVTDGYRTYCDTSGTQGQEIPQRFNISLLFAPDAPCALSSSSAPKFTRRTRSDGSAGKTRKKRSWFFPGTLWCGTGSKASNYEQLGMFQTADKCCREHDHCLHVILGLTKNYGLFNPNFFTVSHCNCDQRFQQCLLSANDTIASMVGYTFFSVLKVPCFELKMQKRCTEMYWWGACKESGKAPQAVLRSPLPFNTSRKHSNNPDKSVSTSNKGQNADKSSVIKSSETSPKSEHRCRSNDVTKEDTFHVRQENGKGCKRHRKLNTVAPSQIAPMSRAHTTTSSIKTFIFNVSKSSAPNKKKGGKKNSTRKGLSAHTTQRSRISPQVTTNSHWHTTSTTQSTPSLTEEPTLQLHSATTIITAVTKTTTNRKKNPKQSPCCGFKVPMRGDNFDPHCKGCLRQNMTYNTTTASPSTYGLPTANKLKKTTETPKEDTLRKLWSTTTSATLLTTKVKTTASTHKHGKPQKQMESPLLQNNTNNQRLCGSLKHLDDCKYKIQPLEKKYGLQNMESKSAYHCDCTSRLAVQIESFKQASILPTLLMDFVSQYCFKLPEGKKCHRRKSCSGGFTKASDLLQALKMIEEKDTAGVRKSGNFRRRGIPVRLYKRCLRLEREATIMAQFT
ncbi:group 3 secretory phospholipase A2-like [Plectropomus leopardus]|uniref:group 3 secretory phospholipase A2-like n=1 Tax=Plectropomus leopardus TaxID=160734 RepID=UPI001C4BE864|nr:group 3 secretory phospholipase A2-like [Plectropomus leopardus]